MATDARARLIGSAIDLIRRDGVAGTGINEVVKHSGAARRSIYLNFPGGKDQLVAEAIAVAGKSISRAIHQPGTVTPAQLLTRFTDMWKATLVGSNFGAGCPVAAGALAGSAAPSAPAAAGEAFTIWESLLADHFTAFGFDDDIARSLGSMAVSAIEGAVVVCISTRTTRPLDVVQRHLDELLKLHNPAR